MDVPSYREYALVRLERASFTDARSKKVDPPDNLNPHFFHVFSAPHNCST